MAEVGSKTGKTTQAGKDVYETSAGEMVSEKSTTFKYKGSWINVPSIFKGEQYDDDTLRMMLDAEVIEPTSTHKTKSEAIKAAEERSKSLKFSEGGLTDQKQQAFNFEDTAPPAEDNQSLFGYTAEGLQQEADKYAAEFTEDDSSSLETAASYLVPYYDSGVNIANVVEEYLKPEEERDYDYIKSQFKEAGQSAALETGLLLMGGVATKYGAKGIKALANKARQYEVDPNSMSAFGVGAVKKKASKPLEIGFNEALQDGQFLKGYNASTAADMAEKAKNATAGNTRANALMNAAVPEGTRVGVRLNLNSTIPDMPRGLDKLQTLHKGSFSGKAMSYLPFATVRNVTFNVSQKGRTAIASRINKIDTPEAKSKFPAMSVDGDYVPNKNLLDEGGDLVEVGLNPKDHHLFIDLKTGQAVKGAEEATIIGDRVYARGVEYWKKAEAPAPTPTQTGVDIPSDVRFKFKKGGMAMDDQMKLTFKSRRTGYALGGEVEAIDPVSGNEVPPGSTPEEVRDDIPAMLSEGEYVVPADVTRYYGVKFFEDLREQAKVDLEGMAANGRIGGEPMPEGEDDLTEDEMALLQEVMAEDQPVGMNQGGMVNQQVPYLSPQQPMSNPQLGVDPSQPTSYTKPLGMAAGGSVAKDPFGNPIQPVSQSPNQPAYSVLPLNPTNPQGIYGVTTAAGTPYTAATPPTTRAVTSTPSTPTTGTSTPTADTSTSTGGMATKFFINKDCVRISVLMLNGNPISSVPANFNEYVEDTPENSARFGCSITDTEETTDTTDTTATATDNATVDSDDDNTIDNYNVNVKTTVDPDTPDGVRKMYEDSGVNANDPLTGAKNALSDAFKVPKAAGSFLTAINPFLGVAGAGINAISQLSALSKANANLKMADFLGMTEASEAIQKEIDAFLEKAPGIVSSLDSVFAKGDERFNNALESSLSQYAVEGSVLNVEGLNEVGKKNLKEYLGYDYTEVPLTGGGAVATDPSSQGSTASSYTAPKSDDGFNQGFFTPGETTVKPRLRPSSVSDPISATQETAAESAQATPTKPVKDTVTTSSGQKVKIETGGGTVTDNTGKTHQSEGTVVGGQYAGDGFEWKKSDSGYNTRVYTGVNENKTGSNDTSSSTSSSSGDDSCCFIMLEARYGNGTMDEVVRRYRDEYMTDRNRRGYYKLAEVLVPLMRKSKTLKWVVTKTFADPLVSYGKYYYGENKHGVVFAPIKSFWMKVFDVLGGETEFIRENGEVV